MIPSWYACYVYLTIIVRSYATQRTKIAEKVHKPSFGINFINFELNGFNALIWVPWSPSYTKKFNALIEVLKFI